MSLLVDAANLRDGGAVQVGSAVVSELWRLAADEQARRRWPLLEDVTWALSPEVANNVSGPAPETGVSVARRGWRDAAGRPERVHTASLCVFGPEYSRPRARHRVVGCADGLVLLPWPEGLPRLSAAGRAKRWLKRRVWLRQARGLTLVVEAEHLRQRLIALGADPARVEVVPNAPHPVFSVGTPAPLAVPRPEPDVLLVAYPARGHAHKNHASLVGLHEQLAVRGLDVRFVVTLREEEWARLPAGADAALVNVGPLSVEQMPGLYAACDATIFPSLLETFSVTPLEALATGSPLLAADRDFVRDVAGEAATYFDPLDAEQAARVFVDWWRDEAGRARAVEAGRRLIAALPDARARATAYLDILTRPAR